MGDVKPISDGYPRVVPYLSVDGAAAAIEFYSTVLGATEQVRMDAPGGKIGHAELGVGDSIIMLADVFPESGGRSPQELGGSPVTVMVYVEDVDDVYAKAISPGATSTGEPEDQFYGERVARFIDPFGHRWFIATHVEDVSDEEIRKRSESAMAGG